LLFDFHPYFDWLIFMDILTEVKVKVNLENLLIVTPNASFNIHFRENRMSEVHLVEEMSRQIVSLPVTVADGTLSMDTVEIKEGVFLSEGL